MSKKIHLISNGHSNQYYTPQKGVVYGFNMPSYTHKIDYLCMIDTAAVRTYDKYKKTPQGPVYCTRPCRETAEKLNIQGEWIEAIGTLERRMNSAHALVRYLFETDKPNCIHLWGFDSLYSQDLTSQMDTWFPRPARPPLNQQWHPHWQKFFDADPSIEWIIHIPKGENCLVQAPNLKEYKH